MKTAAYNTQRVEIEGRMDDGKTPILGGNSQSDVICSFGAGGLGPFAWMVVEWQEMGDPAKRQRRAITIAWSEGREKERGL